MALVIYDSGVRIHTPSASSALPRGVVPLSESSRSRELPSSDDRAQTHTQPQSTTATPTRITREQQSHSNRAQQAYESTERLNRRTIDTKTKPSLVSQIMTSPVFTIAIGSTVEETYQQFLIHHVRHLAVVDNSGLCHGVVSEYDLLKRSSLYNQAGPTRANLTIEGTYPTQLIAATPDTSIHQVAITFLKRHLTSMPVISSTGQLLGIVTHTDLVHMVANEAARERWV